MKALCINGSPREDGSTAYLIGKVAEGMRQKNIEVKSYCLGKLNINYCLGCKKCYKEGICIQKDDMDILINELKNADIVVIGTPDYWGDVSGQLKVFFDRNTPYANTNVNRINMPHPKFGIAISVREGPEDFENTNIINSINHYFDHLEITPIAKLALTDTSTLEDLLKNQKEKIDEAYQIGLKVLDLVKTKKRI